MIKKKKKSWEKKANREMRLNRNPLFFQTCHLLAEEKCHCMHNIPPQMSIHSQEQHKRQSRNRALNLHDICLLWIEAISHLCYTGGTGNLFSPHSLKQTFGFEICWTNDGRCSSNLKTLLSMQSLPFVFQAKSSHPHGQWHACPSCLAN